jgi:hypothetical protein
MAAKAAASTIERNRTVNIRQACAAARSIVRANWSAAIDILIRAGLSLNRAARYAFGFMRQQRAMGAL